MTKETQIIQTALKMMNTAYAQCKAVATKSGLETNEQLINVKMAMELAKWTPFELGMLTVSLWLATRPEHKEDVEALATQEQPQAIVE